MKHTPGPWDCELRPAKGETQEFLYIGPLQGSTQIGIDSIFCSIADANLVCAAPDLLTAAKSYLEALDYYNAIDCPGGARLQRRDDARQMLELAIRKAETGV